MGSSYGQSFVSAPSANPTGWRGGDRRWIARTAPTGFLRPFQRKLDRRNRPKQDHTPASGRPGRDLSGLLDGGDPGNAICDAGAQTGSSVPRLQRHWRCRLPPSMPMATYQTSTASRPAAAADGHSTRETIGPVAAGAIAKHCIAHTHGSEVIAWVSASTRLKRPSIQPWWDARNGGKPPWLRCPDQAVCERECQSALRRSGGRDSAAALIEWSECGVRLWAWACLSSTSWRLISGQGR